MATNEARRRVLLVEDDVVLRGATARMLSLHFDVTTASTIAAAREALAHARPDVLITDLRLADGENGEDLLAEVRNRYPAMARVALSAANRERMNRLTQAALADVVLHKVTMTPAEIVAAVHAALASRDH